jgi:hypothetical protein
LEKVINHLKILINHFEEFEAEIAEWSIGISNL